MGNYFKTSEKFKITSEDNLPSPSVIVCLERSFTRHSALNLLLYTIQNCTISFSKYACAGVWWVAGPCKNNMDGAVLSCTHGGNLILISDKCLNSFYPHPLNFLQITKILHSYWAMCNLMSAVMMNILKTD